MSKYRRILIAVSIVVSGMALLPFVAFPSEQIRWQQFGDAYQPPTTEVEIRNLAFQPDPITIPVGTIVRWRNRDDVAHTITSVPAGMFDSGNLAPDERFEVLFDTPGTYSYECTLHPSMTGTVTVLDTKFRVYLPMLAR